MAEPAVKTEFATKQDLLDLKMELHKEFVEFELGILKAFSDFKDEMYRQHIKLVLWLAGMQIAQLAVIYALLRK